MPGDLESGGRYVCMLERQSDRDLYWGPDFRRKGGVNVLVCSCPGERTTCVIEIYMVNSVYTHG